MAAPTAAAPTAAATAAPTAAAPAAAPAARADQGTHAPTDTCARIPIPVRQTATACRWTAQTAAARHVVEKASPAVGIQTRCRRISAIRAWAVTSAAGQGPL